MKTADLRRLAERAEGVEGRPGDRLAEVHARIRTTRRNRVGAAAAVIAALIAAASIVVTIDPSPPEPVGPPYPVDTTHPLTYALGTTVHYGEKTVEAPAEVVEVDVTDAGVVVRTTDGRIWFTEGEVLEQVGTLGVRGPAFENPRFPGTGASWGFVVSDNVGTRAAWLEFPQPGEPELVVFDTEHAEETARVSLGVEPGSYALLSDVTDRYGYWFSFPDVGEETFPDRRVDLATGETREVTEEEYAADQPVINTPRTLMVSHADTKAGETPNYRWIQPGTMRGFEVRNGRVEPLGLYSPFDARDGGTGQRFAFTAPEGYPNAEPGDLVQWLDDDTVVLAYDRGGERDLLECRHSTGACTLAQSLPASAVLPEANGPEPDQAPASETPSTDEPSGPDPVMPAGGRPLTYSDDVIYVEHPYVQWRMRTIQYGARVLDPDVDASEMDLTDDGVVIVAPDGGVYFTSGETTDRIGQAAPFGTTGFSWLGVVTTSVSGSLAAWFTPVGPDRSLVVYDTHEGRVVAEVQPDACVPYGCWPVAVVGNRVYFEADEQLLVLDVTTGSVSETDEQALAEELRSQPRGFVLGDDFETGEVVNVHKNDEVFFDPRGSTLEPTRIVSGEGTDHPELGYGGFDTTGRRLNLQLPEGYTPADGSYTLFQWIDDDRFAVMPTNVEEKGLALSGYGDILVCDIARERCTLAAHGRPHGKGLYDRLRFVPHLPLISY